MWKQLLFDKPVYNNENFILSFLTNNHLVSYFFYMFFKGICIPYVKPINVTINCHIYYLQIIGFTVCNTIFFNGLWPAFNGMDKYSIFFQGFTYSLLYKSDNTVINLNLFIYAILCGLARRKYSLYEMLEKNCLFFTFLFGIKLLF